MDDSCSRIYLHYQRNSSLCEGIISAEELLCFRPLAKPQKNPADPIHSPRSVVVKLSWQLDSWHDEEALYRLAAERGVQGVSHLYRSATFSRLSHGFRGRLVDVTQFCDRELRVQVLGPLCIPLYRVDIS